MDESMDTKSKQDTLDKIKLLLTFFWNQLLKGIESQFESEAMNKLFLAFKSYTNELKEVINDLPYSEIFRTLVNIFCFDFTDATKNSIFLLKLIKIKSLIFDDCVYKQLNDDQKVSMWKSFKKLIALNKENLNTKLINREFKIKRSPTIHILYNNSSLYPSYITLCIIS
jgi:hypothetical protein